MEVLLEGGEFGKVHHQADGAVDFSCAAADRGDGYAEVAGFAAGGGVSDFFAVPKYQAGAGVPVSKNPGGRKGRGIPDVAGDADPLTGYAVRVDGQEFVIGGTSAVAPLWAGMIALMNQRLGHQVGYLNPLLYGPVVGTNAFRDTGRLGGSRALQNSRVKGPRPSALRRKPPSSRSCPQKCRPWL